MSVIPHLDRPVERAFWDDQPCTLVTYHAPQPVMVEFHHSKPVFLQNRLYSKIVYGPDKWVCSNCHDAIHAWLYWLLAMHREPIQVGRLAKAEAQRTFQWYKDEEARLNG